jgi:hypothetical protein
MGRRRVAAVAVGVAVIGVLVAALAIGRTTAGTDAASSPAVAPGVAAPFNGPEVESGAGRAGMPAPPGSAPYAAVEPAPRDGAAASDGSTTAGSGDAAKTDASPLPDAIGRDVVRTAQLTVQVADPTAGSRGVRTAAAAAGGFVAEEQADATGAWLVVRVPAAALDRLVDDVAATGTVLGRSARAQDATEQVVDLDSRVATQQASVTRVRALLAQATSVGDVVAVESELARREADLDSLQRRLATLRDRVALSTLTVELRGAAVTPPSGPPPGFGTGLGAGWAGLKVVGAAVASAAGFVLPFLPLIALVLGVTWVIVRRRRGRGGPGREGGV